MDCLEEPASARFFLHATCHDDAEVSRRSEDACSEEFSRNFFTVEETDGHWKTGAGSAIKVPSYSREARKDTRGFSRMRLREAMGGGAYMVQVQLQLQPLQVYELYSSLGK